MRTLPFVLLACLATPVWAHGPRATRPPSAAIQDEFVIGFEQVARGHLRETTVGGWRLIRGADGAVLAERMALRVAGGKGYDDFAVHAAVRAALAAELVTQASRIHVDVLPGRVRLRGRVDSMADAARAVASLRDVHGVDKIFCRLTWR
jgi:hypothetical protein